MLTSLGKLLPLAINNCSPPLHKDVFLHYLVWWQSDDRFHCLTSAQVLNQMEECLLLMKYFNWRSTSDIDEGFGICNHLLFLQRGLRRIALGGFSSHPFLGNFCFKFWHQFRTREANPVHTNCKFETITKVLPKKYGSKIKSSNGSTN